MNKDALNYFSDIRVNPDQITVSAVLSRMVDGVGFRFFWATDKLLSETYHFKPAAERWTIADTVSHIWDLSDWICSSLKLDRPIKPESPREQRNSILENLYKIKFFLADIDNQGLQEISINGQPFWNLIFGPFEDMVSHVGAIDNLRRSAGDFPEDPRYFLGTAPGDS